MVCSPKHPKISILFKVSGEEKVTFELTSVPIYYAPKYSFSSDKFEG